MTETMLVRATGGGWEELRPQTTMPEGGILELFGDDIGPVLGTPAPVLVAACSPVLSTGSPDAICVDAEGGVWIVQLALDGGGELTLPQLLAFGGGLAGMTYEAFGACCDRPGGGIADLVEQRGGTGIDRGSFEATVADTLMHGRFRLVAIVREAAPTLVQSMRFLNSSGAMGSLYEATSFASSSVSAVRAKAVDVGGLGASAPVTRASVVEADPEPASTTVVGTRASMGGAGFIAATRTAGGERTADLMATLQATCASTFDELAYDGAGEAATMVASLDGADGPAGLVTAGADGSITISFEALGAVDGSWRVRSELCQGMERLLGADLGDVRKISQLNLSIEEHLMDTTLMEALGDLLGDTVEALRGSSGRAHSGAREVTAA